MADQQVHDTGSEFSSSGSRSSQKSAITEDTLRMGTDSIYSLLLSRGWPEMITTFLQFFVRLIEIRASIVFLGFDILQELITFMMFREFLSRNVFDSLGEGTVILLEKRLANNQVLIANTYIAHYVLVSIATALIILILYFTVIQRYWVSNYLLISLCVDSFFQIFNRGFQSFIKVESRMFLLFIKEVLIQLLSVNIINFLFIRFNCQLIEPLQKQSITLSEIAICVSQGIGCIWLLLVMLRFKIFSIEYRGCLTFSLRRLNPIRWKLISQIIINSVTQVISLHSDAILFLITAVCQYQLVSQEEPRRILFFRLAIFWLARELSFIPMNTMAEVFGRIGGYNIALKKATRVYDLYNKANLISFIMLLIIPSIIVGIMPFIVNFLKPSIVSAEESQMLIEAISTGRLGAAGGYFMSVSSIVKKMLLAEEHYFGAALIQLPMLVISSVYIVCCFVFSGDGAQPYYAIFGSDLINGIIGLFFHAYYFVKYRKLYLLNKAKSVNIGQIEQDEKIAGVRESVVNDLNAHFNEKEDAERIIKSRINKMFDKHVALNQSKQFLSLRDTMNESERTSQIQRSSAMIRYPPRNSRSGTKGIGESTDRLDGKDSQ